LGSERPLVPGSDFGATTNAPIKCERCDELVEALESTRRGYTLTGESVSQQRDRALARYREASDE
jgi:hypothetical protein